MFHSHARHLPKDAAPISAEWPIKEGGVCAYAWTDEKGRPFIAVKTLNRIGKPTGAPDWINDSVFVANMVVGFCGDRPLIMNIHAELVSEGLELIIRPPEGLVGSDFYEHRFSAWGGDAPCFSLSVTPTFDPLAIHSYPFLERTY